MPILTIRNLPENIHSALCAQAALDGLSVEDEARKIISQAMINNKKPSVDLQQLVDLLYQGKKTANVVDKLIQERRKEAESE